jgi:hypothetical protein
MHPYIALLATTALMTPILANDFGGNNPSTSPSAYSAQPIWPSYTYCMNDDQAIDIVDQYMSLLEQPGGPDFNSTAESLLADDFIVFSDSINLLSDTTVSLLFPLY